MSRFLDRLIIDGEKMDLRVERNVVDGSVLRTMDGASTVDITIHDPDRELITNGVLTRRKRIKKSGSVFPTASQLRLGKTLIYLDGDPFRLAGISKTGSNLELQFEHEIVAILRSRNKPRVNSRKYSTRAQFIRRALLYAEGPRTIAVYMPSLSQRQPKKKPDVEPIGLPDKGLGKKDENLLQINGKPLNPDQRRNFNIVIARANHWNAGEKAITALIAGVIGESGFSSQAENGDTHAKGVFQILPRWTQMGLISPDEVSLGADVFLNVGFGNMPSSRAGLVEASKKRGSGGAIALAQRDSLTPGMIASLVEGSDADGSYYDKFVPDAQALIEAAGSGAGGDVIGRQVRITEDYLYYVGNFDENSEFGQQRENYWEGAQRLAAEVRWPLFVSNNMVWFAKDRDLFQSSPAAMVAEQPGPRMRKLGVQYVGNIDFEQHYNRPVEEVRFSAHVDQFFAFPGAPISVVGMGLADGKYLIEEVRDDMTSTEVEIVARRPLAQLAEPANSVTVINLPDTETTPARVGTGDLTYPLPTHGSNLGGVAAHRGKPGQFSPIWQNVNAVDIGVPRGTPVLAVEDGEIIRLGGHWDGTGASNPNGWNITLVGSTNTWFYTHLMTRVPLEIGIKVKAGQRLGTSGAAAGVDHIHIASEHGDPEKLLGV